MGWLRPKIRRTEAVPGVSLTVAKGELFGLLGPNGAGETTTIKMLNTLLIPSGGTARIFGHDVVQNTNEVRRRIGYVLGGDRGLYDRLSALDNAVLAASALCLFGGTMAVSHECRFGTLGNVLLSPRSKTVINPGRPQLVRAVRRPWSFSCRC